MRDVTHEGLGGGRKVKTELSKGLRICQCEGMPELSLSLVMSVMIAVLCLLVVQCLMMMRLMRRVSQIAIASARTDKEREKEREERERELVVKNESAFESFLKEDPSRMQLTKSEQFAAYRQWRKNKGLNWKTSGAKRI